MKERPADVQRIAVLRANGLGDLMFTLPALDALRAAYPAATITLLGKPWHASFLAGRPGPIDEVFVLPDLPGITAPASGQADGAEAQKALDALRARRFDLGLQLFGGGRHSNPFVNTLGARYTAGLRAEDAVPLDADVPYRYFQSEVFRMLEVVGLVGAPPVTLEPRLGVTPADQAEATQVLAEAGLPFASVFLHPGAGDGRRRWPPQNFARLATRLVESGLRVAVLGAAEERSLTGEIARLGGPRVTDLGGRLSLGGLAGLLSRARLLVANDSGPLHLARAVGAPTVAIFWCGNLINAGPLMRSRHRPLLSWRLECPVCGTNCIQSECAHSASFVADVAVEQVLGEVFSLLGEA